MKQPPEPLSDRDRCRLRPGMYIGNVVDGSGLQNLVWELLGNALDVYLRGAATWISLAVDDTTLIIADDGSGIDVTLEDGVPRLVGWLTSFHGEATADGHYPHVHLRPKYRGYGLATAFFLAEHFEVETVRLGRRYRAVGHQGVLQGGLMDLGPDDGCGTCIRLVPDATIFSDNRLDLDGFRPRLDHLAAFNPGLDLRVQGRRVAFDDGIRDLLRRSVAPATPIGPLFYYQGGDDILVEIALQWFAGVGSSGVFSFMNFAATVEGGTHVTGVHKAMRQVLRHWADHDGRVWHTERMYTDLALVIHVEMHDPRFGGPRRDHLISEEVEHAVVAQLSPALSAWLADHPDFREILWRHLGLMLLR